MRPVLAVIGALASLPLVSMTSAPSPQATPTPQQCFAIASYDFEMARVAIAAGNRPASAEPITVARDRVERWRASGEVDATRARAILGELSYEEMSEMIFACDEAPSVAATPASQPQPTPQQCYVVADTDYDLARAALAAGRDGASMQKVAAARARVERWTPTGQVSEAEFLRIFDQLSSSDRTAIAQACDGSPAAAPQQAAFRREDGVDRPGNDLGAIEVPPRDYDGCQAACQANSRCVAFTVYTPPPHAKGFCWLKHAAGTSRTDSNSITGVRQ